MISCVFLWLTGLSVDNSRSIHFAANGIISLFSGWVIVHAVHVACLYPFICQWTFWLSPCRVCACLVAQLYLTLCSPMDCSPPGSPIHGFFEENTGVGSLSLLQGIFPTQGLNQASRIAGGFFTSWATREAQKYWIRWPIQPILLG